MFGKKETKEEKQLRKEQELLAKYRLDDLTDPKDIQSVKQIVSNVAGLDLMQLGIAFGGGTERDILKTQLLLQKAIFEQNMLIIRLLDRIANK